MYPKMYIQSASNFQKILSNNIVYNHKMNSNLNVKSLNNTSNIIIEKKKQTLKELLTPIKQEVEKAVKENVEKPKGKWKLDILEPMTKEVRQTLYFKSLAVLSKEVPLFNYDTWRNIALGRSKTYQKFIRLEKI